MKLPLNENSVSGSPAAGRRLLMNIASGPRKTRGKTEPPFPENQLD